MANALVASELGSVVGSILHTGGAIAYLAGLALWVAWARSLRQGHAQPQLLMWGSTVTYVAIVANLLGGFMRTYQPGHPRLWEVATEPWAAIMVGKHVVLFAGMFVAVWLFEIVAPRMRRAMRDQTLDKLDQTLTHVATGFVAFTILFASILGAVSTVVQIGEDSPDPGPTDPGGPTVEQFAGWASTQSGTTTGAGPTTSTFNVGPGAIEVKVVLKPGATNGVAVNPAPFTLTLTSPGGDTETAAHDPADLVVAPGPPPSAAYPPLELAATPAPAGDWAWSVSAAALAAYDLEIYVIGPAGITLTDTVTLGSRFYEINLEMEEGDSFDYEWVIAEGHEVHFDIHTHFDGEVQYIIDGDWASYNGTYVAGRTGGHSLLWENEHPDVATLTYTLKGNFTVDSIFS